MKSNILIATLTAIALTATASFAVASGLASLDSLEGKVLLDQGKGFAAPALSTELNVGDRIFVGDGAQVAIEFDTCILSIQDKTVYSIPASSPCALAKDVSEVTKDGEYFIAPAAVTAGPQYVYKNGKRYLVKKKILRYTTRQVTRIVRTPVYQTTLVPAGPAGALPGTLGSLVSPGSLVGGLILVGGVWIVTHPVSQP